MILYFARWIQRYGLELGPNCHEFYRTILYAEDSSKAAVFLSWGMQQNLRRIAPLSLQCDATFKVCPRAGGAAQLFVVHAFYEGSVSTYTEFVYFIYILTKLIY